MQRKNSGFIKYLALIIIVLGVVFVSQQPYFKKYGENLVSEGASMGQSYIASGSAWLKDHLLESLSGEVEKRGEAAMDTVEETKENISDGAATKIKDYFSGIVDAVIHPGKSAVTEQPANCPPVANPYPTK